MTERVATGLVHEKTNEHVYIGDPVTDFRGESLKVLGTERPRHSGSTGRVYVIPMGTSPNRYAAEERGFYPSVFGLKWPEP